MAGKEQSETNHFSNPGSFSTSSSTSSSTCCCSGLSNGLSSALVKFHMGLKRTFHCLGKTVAEKRGYFIVIPLFLTALCMTGFQKIHYEDDPEYLFAPTNGAARGERAVIEENFQMNFSLLFDPTRITRAGRFARFIVVAKDNGSVFRESVWKDIARLDEEVRNVVVTDEGLTYHFKDICAMKEGECFKNEVMGLGSVMKEVEAGTFDIQYPINLEPFLLPHFFGGIETDEKEEVMLSAKAITLFYWIRTNDEVENRRGKLWEKKILKTFENRRFSLTRVARFTSTTLEDELEKNTNSVKPFVAVTLTIMTVFSVFACLMGDWVRGKPLLGVVGVLTAVLSSFTAFGFLIYIGVPFIGINMAAPFLMLGIGIDDTFVLLAAWRRTRLQDPIPARLADTYSEAAVSISITSLTDMVSFFIGVITPFPSVQIFCLYTGTAVFVTYLWHITLFGGCLAVAGYAEQEQRHSLICVRVKPKSVAEGESWLYSALCAGGISHEDPWNEQDNRPHSIMVFFRDYIGNFLNIPAIKTFVICIFLLYLGGAIFGCTMVKEGLEKRRLSRYDSYSVDFYDLEDKYFRVYPYSIQVVITGNVTYSDSDTKADLLALMQAFESESYIDGEYTQSVIRYWYLFLEENEEWLDFNITDEASFIKYLREVYVSDPSDILNLDIRYNDDFTRILATRFIIQTYNLPDSNADKDMMEGLRFIANNSKFNATIFNPFFVFFDQFVLVRNLSIQAISLAAGVMMCVSFVFIPNPWCSMWVAFSIVSIEVGVVGYMTMWGVSLDSISMINLIMCIGFSVDFSAHISYAYLTAKVDTPDERVKECLFTLGFPIIQGGVSTILGVIALTLAPSYIFVTFFKIVFLVIFFGIMHGIFLLPVLLSLVGPGSFKKKEDPDLYNPNKIFIKKSELQTNVFPAAIETKSDLKTQTKESQTAENFILQPGTFMSSTSGSKACSDKYPEHQEKDMGLGTSGEDSSEGGSFQEVEHSHSGRGPSVVKVPEDGKRNRSKQTVPIKEVYSNKGYTSDSELEDVTFRHSNNSHPPRGSKHRHHHHHHHNTHPRKPTQRGEGYTQPHIYATYANERFHNGGAKDVRKMKRNGRHEI